MDNVTINTDNMKSVKELIEWLETHEVKKANITVNVMIQQIGNVTASEIHNENVTTMNNNKRPVF